MPHRDVIVIGASTGGVVALSGLARGLPAGFPASLLIVCHFPPDARSVLPEILSRAGPLLAVHAVDGETFHPGHIYIAPPDWHLLLGPDRVMRLSRAARENHHRPAVDPLFRTAARYYGPRVVGVVLTGALHDGSAGLMAVRAAGGVGVVQEPGEAAAGAMPENAATLAGVDYVTKLSGLAPLLDRLVHEPTPDRPSVPGPVDPIERMEEVVARDMEQQSGDGRRGGLSVFTCPECGGALWQVDESEPVRFRCHVGHAYQAERLLSEQTEALEAALWTAVRTFREKQVLAGHLARMRREEDDGESAARFEEQATQAAGYGELIRSLLLDRSPA